MTGGRAAWLAGWRWQAETAESAGNGLERRKLTENAAWQWLVFNYLKTGH